MDRKNLVHDNFTMKIVLHWRLLLEKYGPTIKYIKRSDRSLEGLCHACVVLLFHPPPLLPF